VILRIFLQKEICKQWTRTGRKDPIESGENICEQREAQEDPCSRLLPTMEGSAAGAQMLNVYFHPSLAKTLSSTFDVTNGAENMSSLCKVMDSVSPQGGTKRTLIKITHLNNKSPLSS
jgi:hypothetical protein